MYKRQALLFLMYAVTLGARTLLAERREGTLARVLAAPVTSGQVPVSYTHLEALEQGVPLLEPPVVPHMARALFTLRKEPEIVYRDSPLFSP